MSDSIGTAFCNGIEDRHVNGLHWYEPLYRSPLSRHVAWRLGWELANLLTGRALRSPGRSAHTKGATRG